MATVYFFGTCMVDLLSPFTGYHIVRLLEVGGCRVIFPAGQTCCGQPAYNSGYRDQARKVALSQSELFPENYPILLPSGSCAAMMHHHYRDLFPDHPQMSKIGDRVEEWSRYYYRLNPSNPSMADRSDLKKIRVAWHGSCHSLREMGVGEEPLSLLKKLPEVEVVTLTHQRECCGFGGTFAVKFSDISAAMGESKCREIIDSGAEVLVSSDVGCMTHILSRMKRMKKINREIPGYHLADFLAMRLGVNHPDFPVREAP